MFGNGLVKSSHAIVSAHHSDILRRFPGFNNLYKAVLETQNRRRGGKSVSAQTAWAFYGAKVKPRLATDAIRFTLARLSGLFDWPNALTIVKPDTLIRWHRKGFRLFWKRSCEP